MGTINPDIPTVGQPNSSEQPKITNGMTTIKNVINGNLDDDNIKSGANINGNKLLAASVDTTQLAADAVTNAKIEDGAVDTEHLAADSVTNAKIDAGAVGTTEIANDAVTADKLTASWATDTLGSNFINLAASGVQTAFSGADRAGGISVVMYNLNVELAGGAGSNVTLYFNIYSGTNVNYHTVQIRRDPSATSDIFPVNVQTISNASATWSPNVTIDTGGGVTTVLAGSKIQSFRIA